MNRNIILQDSLLNQVRKNQIPVIIHLTNGYQLRGTVKAFDSFVVLLNSEGKQMMIYKHAISTIMPTLPVHLDAENGEDTPE